LGRDSERDSLDVAWAAEPALGERGAGAGGVVDDAKEPEAAPKLERLGRRPSGKKLRVHDGFEFTGDLGGDTMW
jgi:hypothetical protein